MVSWSPDSPSFDFSSDGISRTVHNLQLQPIEIWPLPISRTAQIWWKSFRVNNRGPIDRCPQLAGRFFRCCAELVPAPPRVDKVSLSVGLFQGVEERGGNRRAVQNACVTHFAGSTEHTSALPTSQGNIKHDFVVVRCNDSYSTVQHKYCSSPNRCSVAVLAQQCTTVMKTTERTIYCTTE